jgi:DNA-binding NarL/FixJ family response regulator
MEFIFEEKKEVIKPNLTTRENEVLGYILKGLNNIEIAEELHVCKDTIKSHRCRLYEKHNVHSFSGLLKLYLK